MDISEWQQALWGRACQTHERSEEHTSELQSPCNLVCRLLLEKKNKHGQPHRRSLNYIPHLTVAIILDRSHPHTLHLRTAILICRQLRSLLAHARTESRHARIS